AGDGQGRRGARGLGRQARAAAVRGQAEEARAVGLARRSVVSPALVALLSAIVFVTSIVGVITGGNSLVNVPVMIMLGLSPRTAVATNMFAVTFMTASATARFAREGRVVTRL